VDIETITAGNQHYPVMIGFRFVQKGHLVDRVFSIPKGVLNNNIQNLIAESRNVVYNALDFIKELETAHKISYLLFHNIDFDSPHCKLL
jgi:hypothetical protein